MSDDKTPGGEYVPVFPSIRDALPREKGGPEARRGFRFQDHIAAGYTLVMIGDAQLLEVRCEAEDDITLIWRRGEDEIEPEFVQVKNDQLDQLWSIALLCQARGHSGDHGATAGTSIFERSLARDSYEEDCTFRIVTAVPVKRELRHLAGPRGHPRRQPGSRAFEGFAAKFPQPLKSVRSPKRNDWTYWVERVVWDVQHADTAVRDRNLHTLEHALSELGFYLAPDQREYIYELLLRRVFDAGADDDSRPESKRFVQEEVRSFLSERAARTQEAPTPGTESPLERKMREANLGRETILHAKQSRLRYLLERRTTRYYARPERDRFEDEIADQLHRVWADYQAGAYDDTPQQFYARCLHIVDQIRIQIRPDGSVPAIFAQGAMYDRVQRCLHRFDRTAS